MKPTGYYDANVAMTRATQARMKAVLERFRLLMGGGDFRKPHDRRYGAASQISLLAWMVVFTDRHLTKMVEEIGSGELEFPEDGLATRRLKDFEDEHHWAAIPNDEEIMAARFDWIELWPQMPHDPDGVMSLTSWKAEVGKRAMTTVRLRYLARYRRGDAKTYRPLRETVANLVLDQDLKDPTSVASKLPPVSQFHREKFKDDIAAERERRMRRGFAVSIAPSETGKKDPNEPSRDDPLYDFWDWIRREMKYGSGWPNPAEREFFWGKFGKWWMEELERDKTRTPPDPSAPKF